MAERETMDIKTAAVVNIGTELLLGQTVNQDAQILAAELSGIGINCYAMETCGDNPERIRNVLQRVVKNADLIITTGGLGPTEDDITINCVAQTFGLDLAYCDEVKKAIAEQYKERFSQVKIPKVIAGAEVFPSHNGTAPACLAKFTHDGTCKYVLTLPGPPSELRDLLTEQVVPYLNSLSKYKFKHVYIKLAGIGESEAERRIKDLIWHGHNPTYGIYISDGEVLMRLTQRVLKDEKNEDLLTPVADEICRRLADYVYARENIGLPAYVLREMTAHKQTLAFAESCTAGRCAAAIGALRGASQVLQGGIIAYQDDIKIKLLGVNKAELEKYTAVSAEVAKAMAAGAKELFNADFAVAITGYADLLPKGAIGKAGQIFLAVASPQGIKCEEILLHGQRVRVQKRIVAAALNLLRQAW